MKFILWDPKDGRPRYDDGECISDGLLGRLDEGNVYLTTYAEYEGSPRHTELEVGGWTEATFRLSGSKGRYKIYRVE